MPTKRKDKADTSSKQRAFFLMIIAGIVVAFLLGFSLVQLGLGTALAGSNKKLDAINAIQLTREAARNNPHKPPKNPHQASVSHTSSQPWASGIIESGQAPFSESLYVINNQWQEVVDGEHLSVYAGAESQDSSQGLLIVMTTSLDLQTNIGPHVYLTSSHIGSLRIIGASGQSLTLISTSNARFTFFVTPVCAMSQPTMAGIECQLRSTSAGT